MEPEDDTQFDFRLEMLAGDSTDGWDALIRALRPPSMLVLIEARMGSLLRTRLAADDVWQEALLLAWRNRGQFEGTDLESFRAWILALAEDRLRFLIDHDYHLGFGGTRPLVPFRTGAATTAPAGPEYAGPAPASAPLRAARDREEAAAIRAALDALAPELRYVVWLAEFEGATVADIAERMEFDEAVVRDRLRKGLIAYQHRLRAALKNRVREIL